MRNFFRTFLLSLLALVLIFVGGGYILPSHYALERTIQIQAPIQNVFETVSDLQTWKQWNPWFQTGTMEVVVGKNMQDLPYIDWKGDQAGMGRMDVTKLVEPTQMESKVRFYVPKDTEAFESWTFQEMAGATQVTWSNQGQLEDVVSKWVGLFANQTMGGQFDKALANLKNMLEKR